MLDMIPMLRTLRPASFIRWLPVLVLLVAAFLRFHQIGTQSLWNDEGNSLRLAQRSIPALIEAAGRDIHPPGYYLALKGWIALFGESEVALRSLSAFLSLLAVAFTYALGKRWTSAGVGLIASGIVALNSFQVYYAQETRMYALLALCAAASMWAYLGWTARPTFRRSLLLVLINTAGLYTHFVFPAVMVTQGIMTGLLILFTVRQDHPRTLPLLGRFFVLSLLTIVLFLPILPTALQQVGGWPRTGVTVEPLVGLATTVRWLIYGNTAGTVPWYGFLWPTLFGIAALLPDWVRRRQPTPWRVLLPYVWLFVTIAPFFALGLFREANLKFLLPIQIGLALILARGIWLLWEIGSPSTVVLTEALPRLFAGMGVLSGLYFFSPALDNLYSLPQYARDDYRAMAAAIMVAPRPDDAIILDAPNQEEVFTYYYRGTVPIFPLPVGLGGDDAAAQQSVQDVIRTSKRIFVLYWGENERDPRRVIETELNTSTFPALSRYYGNVRFVVYAVPGTPATSPTVSSNTLFGTAIRLQGYALDQTQVRQGDVFGITLFWRAAETITKRYKVFIHLIDGANANRIVAQRDAEPGNNQKITSTWKPGETVIDLHGLLVPPTLPPGTYQVVLGLYDLDDPLQRLSIGAGDTFSLGALIVTPG